MGPPATDGKTIDPTSFSRRSRSLARTWLRSPQHIRLQPLALHSDHSLAQKRLRD